jgi:ABC-type lipoprotein export system ATPase subunit
LNFSFYKQNSEKLSFSTKSTKDFDELDFPISLVDDIIPELSRVGPRTWRNLLTREIFSLEEIIDRYGDLIPSKISKLKEEPEWLQKIKCETHVRLIESQRLLNINIAPKRSSKIYSEKSSMLPTVSAYSDELAQLMRDKFTEYGMTAQALDRSFPTRLVKQRTSPDLTDEQLREQLSELEATRSRLIDVGLLDKNENSDFQIQPQSIDESTKNILSVYVADVEQKLNVFDSIADKIDLLRRIINSKFAYSHKEMNFSKEKGFVFKTHYNSALSDSDTLSPTDLSSGEQHELVLLYELLFKVQPNSLVLIDEPELSLHVGWQNQFLKDLREITELADLDVLMATHSPDIIQDRWDLTVELKGPAK